MVRGLGREGNTRTPHVKVMESATVFEKEMEIYFKCISTTLHEGQELGAMGKGV